MSARSPRSGARPSRRSSPIEYSLLLTATLCLLALGAVMVFSASSATTLLASGGEGDGAYYLKRMVVFAGIGLVVMRLASLHGARTARLATPGVLTVSLVLLAAVLLPGVGQSVNGAQRWMGTGLFEFQPSELAKIAVILYGAHLLASEPKRIRDLHGLAPLLGVVGLALFLIFQQPDLGTSIAITIGVGCLMLAAGVHPRTLMPVGAVLLAAAAILIAMNPYQQERLTSFLNPGTDTEGAGFQGRQAAIAIGSGGVMGVGLGESVQKAFYLPEAHTDMIAAVIGEEAGLAGMIVLIGLFGMYGYAGFRAAHRARDRYGKLLAAGLTSLILGQAAVNLFAVMGLAPLTGVPLPFVSYGGTSLIVTLAATGLILNVARRPARSAAKPRRSSSRAIGTQASRRRAPARRARTASGGAAARAGRLRVVEGGTGSRRRSVARGTSGDSGRRDGGARRAGDRRRRRASG